MNVFQHYNSVAMDFPRFAPPLDSDVAVWSRQSRRHERKKQKQPLGAEFSDNREREVITSALLVTPRR